jgi:prevent-host-death family protein
VKRDTWQLQRAKANLSKLIETTATRGPQTVTRHGRPAAVVLSAAAYRRLCRKQPDFKAFLRRARLQGLDLARSRDRGRELEL